MCIRGFHRLGYEVGFARVSPRLNEAQDDETADTFLLRSPSTLASRQREMKDLLICTSPICPRL